MSVASREEHLVELVDDSGRAVGSSSVAEAHQLPGKLHRAFSVLLVAPDGRILLQQRAAVKTRFPLRWANACCGHPAPGQTLAEAANQRLHEELGVGPVPLTELGVYVYRAEDPATGRVEVEYDHVLRGEFTRPEKLRPNPAEVADLRWVDPVNLAEDLDRRADRYAPWLVGIVDRLLHPGGPVPGPPAAAATASAGVPDASERSGGR